jgi:hypothetical protein
MGDRSSPTNVPQLRTSVDAALDPLVVGRCSRVYRYGRPFGCAPDGAEADDSGEYASSVRGHHRQWPARIAVATVASTFCPQPSANLLLAIDRAEELLAFPGTHHVDVGLT